MLNDLPSVSQIRWLRCKNTGSETIPAFGAVRSATAADGTGLLRVDRPDEDSEFVYIVNHVPIAPGGYGLCTRDDPIFALYDDDDAPSLGDEWGAQAGSFELEKGNTGWVIEGEVTNGRVYVRRSL